MEKDKKQVVIASIVLVILVLMMLAVIIIVTTNRGKQNDLSSPTSDIIDVSNKYVAINDYNYEYASNFDNFRVQKVEFRNLDDTIVNAFLKKQQEFINRIDTYNDELFASNDDDMKNSRISGVVTLISHDNLLSVVYKYQIYLPQLEVDQDGTFAFNLNADTEETVDNKTLFNENDRVARDIASELYASVISGLDFTKDTYVDLDSGKRVTKDTINTLKDDYIDKIERYLDEVSAYMDNGSVMIVYKESDILKLLFKIEDIQDSKDIIYIA